ncbi:MAG: efflux RND transporter permease subunit [Planctomycetes bacterium]|nr:efflux RND transporter permease subunit [Planctomycetota bacterium]
MSGDARERARAGAEHAAANAAEDARARVAAAASDDAPSGLVARIVEQAVRGPLSPLVLVAAALAGVAALLLTPREEEPQIVVPTADVQIAFPGASAAEVETLVATPLEKLLWQLEGVEHVYSVSRREGAVVTVRFFVGQDRERALVRLASAIEAHKGEAPPGVAGWSVRPVDIDDVPILALTLHSDALDEGTLRRVGEELLARLETVEDVSKTSLIGGLSREVRVELDADALAARALTGADVQAALARADAAVVAGGFDRADRRVDVLAGPFLESARDVGALVVGVHDGTPVHLSEVARVVDGPAEADALVHVAFGPAAEVAQRGLARRAVTLTFAKKRGTNAVAVSKGVLAELERVRATVVPAGVDVLVSRDWGRTADDKVDELYGHLLLAIATVIALVCWILGWREGFIVAAAVPVTFALTLLVNLVAGYTVNRVTLFALVLVLGLVCDDPIVDVENVHRHLARGKLRPLRAVLVAVNEVRPPVIVATLAVMLSFLPLFFITGMMGPYMRPMALTVPVAMAMSLLVAFTITPWMAYLLLAKKKGAHGSTGAARDAAGAHGAPSGSGDPGDLGDLGERATRTPADAPKAHADEPDDGALLRMYRRVLVRLVERRGARAVLGLVLAALTALAGVLVVTGRVPLKMLPYDDKQELELVLDLPEGSTLEATDRAARDLERVLVATPEVEHVTSYVGRAGPIDFNGLVRRYDLRRGPHLADLRVGLAPKHARERKSHVVALAMRKDLEAAAARHGARLSIVEIPPGPPVLATLVAEVHGRPERAHAELVQAARDVAGRMANLRGVVDVDVLAEDEHERLDFRLDREKAALHGVTADEVARTLRLALGGVAAATVHEAGERQPLLVRAVLPRAERSGESELGRLGVRGAEGGLVPLAELGRFGPAPADAPIYHKDLERVVFVVGEIAGRAPYDAVAALQEGLAKKPLPDGIEARWTGEGEWKLTLDVFRDLGLAFGGALVGIYVLLVLQTGSFGLAAIVLLAIPLGLLGILPGFWLLQAFGSTEVGGFHDPVWFTATAMIGMIALAGIAVRNSIILIDFAREKEAAGMPLREAVIESGVQRLRPIVLTAGAAMLGAWPITLDPIFSGLAWSLIFGLVASTVFSALVIPLAYHALRSRALRHARESGDDL